MNKKKLVAAIAAVCTYIKTSEEAHTHRGYNINNSDPILAALAQTILQVYHAMGITDKQAQAHANSILQKQMFS